MNIDPTKFHFGIEHEFPCVDKNGSLVDFSTAIFDDLDRVIQELPVHESDYPGLRIGDLGIKKKRWYIEGFERFDEQGTYTVTEPKGFEIRTPICTTIDEAVDTLQNDFLLWRKKAMKFGYKPASVSYNPFLTEYHPEPPLNEWETASHRSSEYQSDFIYMLTYGPDISFSHPDFTTEQIIAIGKKLTHYSPFIVPFSFSSPFHNGSLWDGLSYRTYRRTGRRPACLVFVKEDKDLLPMSPTMTEKARIPAEAGRIEFKSFDTIADFELYGSLAALIVGIALDTTLGGSSEIPDGELHRLSAKEGFENDTIYANALKVFEAACNAVPSEWRERIEALRPMLDLRRVPANTMIDQYKEGKNIIDIITEQYE